MVSFVCDSCQSTVKKPKAVHHLQQCGPLSCIDCSETFGSHNVQEHTQCVTEAEKYKMGNGNSNKQKSKKQQPTRGVATTAQQEQAAVVAEAKTEESAADRSDSSAASKSAPDASQRKADKKRKHSTVASILDDLLPSIADGDKPFTFAKLVRSYGDMNAYQEDEELLLSLANELNVNGKKFVILRKSEYKALKR